MVILNRPQRKHFLGTDSKETPIVACPAVTKERVLPLLTRQAYRVHVTIEKVIQIKITLILRKASANVTGLRKASANLLT
jgi:hypothetical protein